MGSHTDANGGTASLKKRKRAPKDEASPSLKRHRSKAKEPVNGHLETVPASEEEIKDEVDIKAEVVPSQQNAAMELHQPMTDVEVARQAAAPWKLSSPMGGRMLDIDPMFSPDEKYLILAYNTSIQVYTTEDSLLLRRIVMPPAIISSSEGYIVAATLSESDSDYLWVASSNGNIWHINWTSGAGADEPFSTGRGILDLAVGAGELIGSDEDILFVLHNHGESRAQIVAYEKRSLSTGEGTLLHTVEQGPYILREAVNGRILVASAENALHVGLLKSKGKAPKSLSDLEYRFYSFKTPDLVACLDIRPLIQPTKKGGVEIRQVDVVVGGARGAVYLYMDLASKLNGEGGKAGSIQPRKYHWHRKAVHSVKFTTDGNYLVSGGYEQVLVLWQLDTSKLTFLPHLAAAIENITVSPGGSSYAIHLDDNSTMVISTEEMKPTAYISGIQSLIFGDYPSKEALVRRVWKPADEISTPLVAATNPLNPSQVFLCVGNGQLAASGGANGPSTPQLQIFDTSSFQGVAKQAIARTNPTDANITSQGAPIIDPTVTKLAFSTDGRWLASVDEWQPRGGDVTAFLTGAKETDQLCAERREVYLKFWEYGAEANELQLLTRVNEPHHTSQPETIFDLVSDPSGPRFATLGGDGVVRFWASKLRTRDGITATGHDGQQVRVWSCSQAVTLPVPTQQDISDERVIQPRTGALAFSEDGSILFAAYGEPSRAAVVAIDTETGEIRETIHGMFRGDVLSMECLGSRLIMLSDDLTVYDVVSDELLYSFTLRHKSKEASQLTRLAVNRESRSFALAAPICRSKADKMMKGTRSELVIFHIDDPEPRFCHTFPQLITAVVPTVSSSGYMIVDSAAQVWSANEGTEQAPLLKSLVDLGVSEDTDAPEAPVPMDVTEAGEASDEEIKDEEDVDMDADEDLDIYPAVVAPQRLADIFNTAPSFAMPPIEDIFYQVAGLFSAKPVET
ncbi:WD40-repeat-containing domain protein [Echria macrotheca]|uniref:WD40-repeat-containing domain protein n=1 Tax=Echria macrotheca TaxID=438768 RepID=A0AAJ0FB67_9PEZI|nr:WD40-repeat-containing domain protein [Echria macrotheca]